MAILLFFVLDSFCNDVKLRVIGVENKLEPHKTISCMRLNQLILDVDRANGGERYDIANVKPSRTARDPKASRHSSCRYTLRINEHEEEELVVSCGTESGLPKVLARIVDTAKQ